MRDDVTFETRLADALGRFAELAPTMDDTAVARQAIATGGASRRTGWLAPLRRGAPDRATAGRTRLRVSVLFIVVALVLAAIVVAIAGGVLRRSSVPILGRNGPIAFTVQGNNHGPASTHIVNADGTGDHPVDADRCQAWSKDGSVLAALSYEGSAYQRSGTPTGSRRLGSLLVEHRRRPVSWRPVTGRDPGRMDPTKPVRGHRQCWARGGTDRRRSGYSDRAAVGRARRGLPIPVWSPDGGHLAFGSYSRDAATGEDRRCDRRPSASSPRTDRVCVGSFDAARPARRRCDVVVTRRSLPGLSPSASRTGRRSPSASVAPAPVDPPGDMFVVAGRWIAERSRTTATTSSEQHAWSPDGAVLAFETSAEGEAHRLTTIHMNGPTPVGQPVLGPV